MKSRMERYYQSKESNSRTSKNKNLYNNNYSGDYDLKSYSNVEGVAEIDKNDSIDLKKIQILLKRREEERKNEVPHFVKRNVQTYDSKTEYDDKNYDIKEILSQAKTEKKDDYKKRSIDNTSFNVLKNITIKEIEDEEEELTELINTVTTTNLINKMEDKDLSLNLLNDLKSNNNTEILNPSEMKDVIKNITFNEKQLDEIDKSFYTSSLGFTEDDFEQLKDITDSIKKNNILIKVLVIILSLVTVAGIIFLILNLNS